MEFVVSVFYRNRMTPDVFMTKDGVSSTPCFDDKILRLYLVNGNAVLIPFDVIEKVTICANTES